MICFILYMVRLFSSTEKLTTFGKDCVEKFVKTIGVWHLIGEDIIRTGK